MNKGTKKGLKRILAICLSTAMLPISPLTNTMISNAQTTSETCAVYTGSNAGDQDYTKYAATVKTALVAASSNTLMRFMADAKTGGYTADYVNEEGLVTRVMTIDEELPIFGAFYDDGNNYYILSGQENLNQSDTAEVYRLTKYDHDWNRLGSASVYGANTYVPFEAGSARMDSDGNILFVRTCHTMYEKDGYHHQANVTLEFDTQNMTCADSFTGNMNSTVGCVSHSFNQFIRLDNDYVVSVDHGDANPRSIVLMKTTSTYTAQGWEKETASVDLLGISGDSNDNATGVSVGGFEVGSGTYVTAFNAVAMGEGYSAASIRNIYVASVDKNLSQDPVITRLTNYTEGSSPSTPAFVRLSGNRFLVLWTKDDVLYYVTVDENGSKTSDIISCQKAELSDCAPIPVNGKVTWFTYTGEAATLYEISVNDITKLDTTEIAMDHQYECTITKEATCSETGLATYTCKYDSTSYTEVIEKNPDNHVGTTSVKNALEATCISNGYTGDVYCDSCQSLLETGETTPFGDHTLTDIVTVEATCQEQGSLTATCSVCGQTVSEILPIADHCYEDYYCIWCNRYNGLNAPVLSKLENVVAGLKLTWKSVDNAYAYQIRRWKDDASDYEIIAIVDAAEQASMNYTDSQVSSGSDYTYAVICIDEEDKECSPVSEKQLSITCLKALVAADLSTANTTAGAKVTFPAVSGAESYNVYRKTGTNGTYAIIGNIPENGKTNYSYTDSTAKSGTTYYYCVRAVKGSCISSYAGKGLYYLDPIVTADLTTSNTTAGARVTFPAITGAESYNVYRKTGNSGTYAKIGSVSENGKANYSYTDSTAESGTTYYYCVRPVKGSYMGSFAGKGIYYLKAIVAADLTTANTTAGARVTFPAVKGADSYNVYRKTGSSGTYARIAVVSESGKASYSYTDSTAVSGNTYYYSVRAVKGSYIGSYAGKGLYYLDPIVTADLTTANTTTGAKVTFPAVKGADSYNVYRKTGSSGTYAKVGSVTESGKSSYSYIDKTAESGITYYYCVRPVKGSYMGSFAGKGLYYLDAILAKDLTMTNVSTGITVKWPKIEGAAGYYIYRKTESGSYARIKEIDSQSTINYIDTAVKSENGTTYTYCVRPYYSGNLGSYEGKTIIRLSTPRIPSASNAATGSATVSYTKNSAATGYQIMYSASMTFSSGNTTVTTTDTSKTISGLTKGKIYYVRIRTYNTSDGVTCYSAWSGARSVSITK